VQIVWQNSTGVTGNMEIWLVYPLNHQLTLQHTCLASARTSVNGSIVLKEDVIDGLKVDANSNQTFFARVNGNNSSEDKLTADYSGTACSASVTAKYWEGADYVV